jgi:hypothetical protein
MRKAVMVDRDACAALLARLSRGEPVAAREIKRAVGIDHWNTYLMNRALMKHWRAEAKLATRALLPYVEMLTLADLRDAQADRMRVRSGNSLEQGKRPSDLYERALDLLAHLAEHDSSVLRHLDRTFSPTTYASEIGPDKESVPRLWFHMHYAVHENPGKAIKTAAELKIEALDRAIKDR